MRNPLNCLSLILPLSFQQLSHRFCPSPLAGKDCVHTVVT